MDVFEKAEQHVFDKLQAAYIDTALVSDTGTVENLMNDGWTPSEIVAGKANDFIFDNVAWLD